MLMVQCKQCGASGFTMDGRHPGNALKCECCPSDHDHDKAANETNVPCRPVNIIVVPGSQHMKMG